MMKRKPCIELIFASLLFVSVVSCGGGTPSSQSSGDDCVTYVGHNPTVEEYAQDKRSYDLEIQDFLLKHPGTTLDGFPSLAPVVPDDSHIETTVDAQLLRDMPAGGFQKFIELFCTGAERNTDTSAPIEESQYVKEAQEAYKRHVIAYWMDVFVLPYCLQSRSPDAFKNFGIPLDEVQALCPQKIVK